MSHGVYCELEIGPVLDLMRQHDVVLNGDRRLVARLLEPVNEGRRLLRLARIGPSNGCHGNETSNFGAFRNAAAVLSLR